MLINRANETADSVLWSGECAPAPVRPTATASNKKGPLYSVFVRPPKVWFVARLTRRSFFASPAVTIVLPAPRRGSRPSLSVRKPWRAWVWTMNITRPNIGHIT